jgi:hypothetical protein
MSRRYLTQRILIFHKVEKKFLKKESPRDFWRILWINLLKKG